MQRAFVYLRANTLRV